MAANDWCALCGDYLHTQNCDCEEFIVYEGNEKMENFLTTEWGKTHEDVAIKLAEKRNSDEPTFDEDLFEDPLVIVDRKGNSVKLQVQASFSIDYFCREIGDSKQ